MQTDIAFRHPDQQVVKQIADLGRELFAAFVIARVLRRDDRFGGFLADLLEYLVEAAVEEITRVGAFGALILSLLDQLEEFLKLNPQIHRRDIDQRERRFGAFKYRAVLLLDLRRLFGLRRLRSLDIPRVTKEAGAFSGVARRPLRIDSHQQRVAVTIQAQIDDSLSGARGLALVPKLLTRTAPEPGLASPQGPRQTFGVHMRDHQNLARVVVLDDGRNQPVIIELQILN